MPTDATAQKIADYFGVSVDALMGDNLLWLIAKNSGQESTAQALEDALAADVLRKIAQEAEKEKAPTPVSESGQPVNVVKIAGRDGSFVEKRLNDKELQALKAFVDLLPDAGGDL